MAPVQLELFGIDEFEDEEAKIKNNAKKYTASSIFRSSGHREFVRTHLEKGDMKSALKEFDECFRNYGFGHKEYSFGTYGGKGKIRVGNDFEFYVTSKELFDVLLGMYKSGEFDD
jgi:hypothetical protein